VELKAFAGGVGGGQEGKGAVKKRNVPKRPFQTAAFPTFT